MKVEINNKTKTRIDISLIEKITSKFLKKYHKPDSKVSIAFVGDKTITKLNKIYRNINKTTDVLAFPGEDEFLGEVLINYSQVKKQTNQYGSSIKQELIFILVHGLLHLLGYDDKTESGSKEMEKKSLEFIKEQKMVWPDS